jgi:16S rRNA (guanine(1405)-N(7))-methyltransferase
MPDDMRHVMDALRASRKYGAVCDDTLARVARWASERAASPRDSVKIAKRRLHQVFGAYFPPGLAGRADAFLAELPPRRDLAAVRRHVGRFLRSHTSTRERIPLLDSLYDDLFSITGVPTRVVDVACGLHPLEIPWMELAPTTDYVALDIDCAQIRLLNAFLAHMGHRPQAACWDVVTQVPPWEADLAFALKCLPCLERQSPGIAVRLIRSLQARWIVASFPAHSLSGKKRRMGDTYAAWMLDHARRESWKVQELRYPQEVFFVVQRT